MRSLGESEVLDVVRAAVAQVLEIDPDAVDASASFADLGADSLALVEVVELIEEALSQDVRGDFRIDDDDLESIETVGAAVDYAVGLLRARS